MVKPRRSRGATRTQKTVRKPRAAIAWQPVFRTLFFMSLMVMLAGAVYWLQKDESLPILHVSVDGKFEHANKQALINAVTPYVTGNFLNVNVAKLREAGEALPWVKSVQVRRRWPDSLHLIVDEQTAVAQWGDTALVNAKGELFSPAKNSFPQGLTRLQGPEGSGEVLTQYYMSASKKFNNLGLNIIHLEMDERRAWTVHFKNGIKLMLGRANNKQRMERFVTIYMANLKQFEARIKTVDMRYTNGLSVVWKSGLKPEFNGAA
ncbi:MAG: hypothetical protein COA90_05560 [Gammaproteobacteria bacterium]|nr:MAG: hypothetical protein COA90_05560 [Gammaproteobacteria bacterium]